MKSPDILKEFKKDNSLIIAGSTWPEDEAILITYINESKTGVKWVIAPHEIDEVHIRQITGRLKRSYILYSDLNARGPGKPGNYDVLIIDNIGLLSGIYAYGEIAYVGGLSIYHVKTRNGTTIRATLANVDRLVENRITWDDDVYFSWQPGAAEVLTW